MIGDTAAAQRLGNIMHMKETSCARLGHAAAPGSSRWPHSFRTSSYLQRCRFNPLEASVKINDGRDSSGRLLEMRGMFAVLEKHRFDWRVASFYECLNLSKRAVLIVEALDS